MRTFLRSFAGGEVTTELFGRIDDVRFQTGVALCQNHISLPHGPLPKRPGSEFLFASRDSGSGSFRLLSFVYSRTDTYIIEFGSAVAPGTGYFRFIKNGVRVMVTDAGTPAAYVVNRTFTNAGINVGTNEITFGVAHGFTTGQPFYITNDAGGAAPPNTSGVTTSTIVYVRSTGATTALFYLTQAEAVAGGAPGQVDFTAPPVATYRANYAYQRGDLVEGTPAGAPGYHYCLQNPTSNGAAQITPGNTAYWYPQPSSGVYEIPHPYIQSNLPFVKARTQSNDVMTLTHEDHTPRTLRRYGTVNWQLVEESFAPVLSAPTNLQGTATSVGMSVSIRSGAGGVVTANPLRLSSNSNVPWINGESVTGTLTWVSASPLTGNFRVVNINGRDFDLVNPDGSTIDATGWGNVLSSTLKATPFSADSSNKYKVTAVDADGNESLASSEVTVTNNLAAEGAYNTLTWDAVSGASRYNVYRQQTGLYGWIGSTDAGVLTLKDDLLDALLDRTPPLFDSSLTGTNPTTSCYHEQRKVFARGQSVWMTRPGTESDLSFSLPVKDDDRIAFTIAATEFSEIQHMVSMGELIVLTASTEFLVVPTDSAVLTPTSVMARPQSFVGSSYVAPVIVNNAVVFAAARGGHVRELSYKATSQGFATGDLSLRAAHLFDGLTIADMAVSKAPYPIVWCVSSNGKLLGLTYVPEQEVTGWHQHTLGVGAVVETVAVASEGTEDRVYLGVRRTVNGATVRYIERLRPMLLSSIADAWFVDAGISYSNTSAGQLSVAHLVGRTVAILADGIVLPNQTVSASGKITLSKGYSKVVIGEPIDSLIQLLPLVTQVEGFAQGQQKAVARAWVRLEKSGPFFTGFDLAEMVPSDSTAASVRGLATAETLVTGRVELRAPSQWTADAQLYIQQTSPLPLTVVSLTLDVAIGG